MNPEQAVLGALINGGDINLTGLLQADFERKDHQAIFGAIESLESENKPIDLITVCDALSEKYSQDVVEYAQNLAENVPGASNLKAYANQVKEKRNKRRVQEIALSLGENLDPDWAIKELMALNIQSRNYECSSVELTKAALESMEDMERGVPSGLADLDFRLGGFFPGDLIVIGARPRMGKTAFMLSLLANCKVPAGVQSTEQGRAQIGQRLISLIGSVSAHKMRLKKLSEQDWEKVSEAASKLGQATFWINDQSGPSIADIERQARAWKHNHDIQILFVDYIQRIKGDKKLPKHERIGDVAQSLKEVARELNIPVVALAQVSRDVEKRENKRPHISDLSDSSEIEKEADQVLTLYRDEVYDEESTHKGIAEISVEKNRHGPTGFIRVHWHDEFMKFGNLLEERSAA